MTFARIDTAVKTCEEHLRTLAEDDPRAIEIQRHLVAALVLIIVSEYEETIESFFVERAKQCGDPHVINYVKRAIAQKFRSPDLSKINETLARFGPDYKEAFHAQVVDTPLHAAWDRILLARQAVVHNQGSLSLTFRELKQAYGETTHVLEKLKSTLGL